MNFEVKLLDGKLVEVDIRKDNVIQSSCLGVIYINDYPANSESIESIEMKFKAKLLAGAWIEFNIRRDNVHQSSAPGVTYINDYPVDTSSIEPIEVIDTSAITKEIEPIA